MIQEEFFEVNIVGRTVKKYKELGYDCKVGDKIKVKVEDIPKQSRNRIHAICDICGKVTEISLMAYWKNHDNCDFYSCKGCKNIKIEATNLERYGVRRPLQNKEIREKTESTNLERYGDKVASKTEDIKNKTSDSNIKKYGCKSTAMLNDIKEKNKNTRKKNILSKYKDFGIIDMDEDGLYLHICKKCGKISKITIDTILNRLKYKTPLCLECNPLDSHNSFSEKELNEYIKSIYKGEIIENDRIVLGGKELDIYLPKLKLAFEYNGLYWHSSKFKENNYHLNKTNNCLDKDIQLIHIYEDEWFNKKDIVKSRIKNILGLNEIKIYGRKCIIKEIKDNSLIKKFLNENHIQGFCGSSIKLGLYYNEELVSLMTFGALRKSTGQTSKEGSFELLRFCNKSNTNVLGGASKLFKYFINNYDFNDIISYADRSWSKGGLYEQLGFDYTSTTKPNYHYVINNSRENRFNYRKDILVKEGFNSNLTEEQIMLDRGYYRIYNSGNLKYIHRNKN